MHLQALVTKWFQGACCQAASLNEIKGSFYCHIDFNAWSKFCDNVEGKCTCCIKCM